MAFQDGTISFLQFLSDAIVVAEKILFYTTEIMDCRKVVRVDLI